MVTHPHGPAVRAAHSTGLFKRRPTAFWRDHIKSILDVSRRLNAENHVTGVLLYQKGLVLQVLEGPPAAVKTLFANIQRDPRHTDVRCLYENGILQREFPDWSMGFRYADFGYRQPPEGFNPLLNRFQGVRIDPAKRGAGALFLATFAKSTQ